ncbi:MAG: serine--tRNA ligase, partial [Burkholderiales bacterium]
MLDLTLLRKDPADAARRLARRGFTFDVEAFDAIESERKAVQVRTEQLQAQRNALSRQIGQLKSRGEDASGPMAEVAAIPEQLKALEADLAAVQAQAHELLAGLPNLPHESVPDGASSEDNVEVRRWSPDGTGPRSFDFEPRDHVDVGAPLGLDFGTAARLSGSRFAVMRGPVARMHRALAQFMLDV